ncbi:MAG: cation:proton antiporter [Caulobacterales bacterium]|jgi:CPA2 family monovalent cation:H+ antiporter-2|nr:cation:proton antiporter [Caulobacterales bacterium]
MEHGANGGEVLTQALVFLGATCLVVPALRRAKLSAVMGFLLIGVWMGPHVLGRLAENWTWLSAFELREDRPTIALAEMGVVFLLFVIGLEVSFERLWALRRYVFGLGLAQVVLTTIAIASVALAFGNDFATASVLGLAFALSSTALVLQLLRERSQITTPVGRISFSVLLMQDLMVVPILFLVAALGVNTARDFSGHNIVIALLTALISLALIFTFGRVLLRPLFRWVASIDSREVFIAAAIFAAIGMAVAAQSAGLSMGLGAFLAGLLLAETEFRHQIETDLEPFKDLLLGLFFVTVGMQIDLALLFANPVTILLGVVGLFAIKITIIAPLARMFGIAWPRALAVAFMLGQAGEFAFVVIASARANGAIPEATADYMLLVTALSIFITPFVATFGGRIARRMAHKQTTIEPDLAQEGGHVVIAGFGRVGQTLADILGKQEIPYVAVDTDSALVASLREDDAPVHYGDSSRRDVLSAIGAANAAAIVVTINDPAAVELIVAQAKQAWPHIPVYARARDGAHARRLHELGATLASPDTIEAALQLGEALLNGIGVPDEAARRIIDERRETEIAKALYQAP